MNTVFPIKNYKVGEHSLPFIESPLLEGFSGLRHGFSTRKGGVSKDYLSSLNLGFSLGDDRENVIENFHIIKMPVLKRKMRDFSCLIGTKPLHPVSLSLFFFYQSGIQQKPLL